MYRFLVISLVLFSFVALAAIIALIVWREIDGPGEPALTDFRAAELTNQPLSGSPANGSITETVSSRSSLSVSDLPELRRQALYLINSERVRAQVSPLTLGSHPAAQKHTENMRTYGYRSHWDTDGMTPQMRYTLAGGTGRVLENVAGPLAAPEAAGAGPEAVHRTLTEAHAAFMSQPAEAANILDPWHRKVSLGIACGEAGCWLVQQFETDHLTFSDLPAISGGRLALAGRFETGIELDGIALWYHAYPRPLGLGQLDATHRHGFGQRPVAFVRPPPPPGQYYANAEISYQWTGGIDPYTLEPALERNSTPALKVDVAQSTVVTWVTADRWQSSGPDFRVTAGLTDVLEAAGPGVYTVQIWEKQGAERTPLSSYAIFVD